MAHAQYAPARLDSVLRALDPATSDTVQLELLALAADSWFTSPKAYPYLARLDVLSLALLKDPDPRVARRAQRARGYYHYYTGYHAKFERNVPLALASFRSALAEFASVHDSLGSAETNDALGVLLHATGDALQAAGPFRAELALARAMKNERLISQALVHLAGCSNDRGRYTEAEAYLDSSRSTDNGDRSAVLNERARACILRHHQEEAEALLRRSLQLAGLTGNEWDRLPVLAPLARARARAGDAVEARALAADCSALAERLGDPAARCACLVIGAGAAHVLHDDANAEQELLLAMELARRTGNVGCARELGDEGSMVGAAALLKDLYTDQGRDREAREMTQLWADLKDSVARMDGREEILTFEFRKQALIDSMAQARRAELQRSEAAAALAHERQRRDMVALMAVCVLAVAVALWSRWRTARRANAAILAAQAQLVTSEKQREAEEVRMRIARDMHDDLGGQLTKLTMLGGEVQHRSRHAADDVTGPVEQMVRISRGTIGALRDAIWSVDPGQDHVLSLHEHMRTFVHHLLDGTALAGERSFTHHGPDRPVEGALRSDLFLLLKEALHNALKHSGGTRVDVRFHTTDSSYELEVADNGKGFDQGEARMEGNGSRNMLLRARRIQARFECVSAPGQGTRIRVSGHLLP